MQERCSDEKDDDDDIENEHRKAEAARLRRAPIV